MGEQPEKLIKTVKEREKFSCVKLEKLVFQWISGSQLLHNMARNEQFLGVLEFKKQWGHCGITHKYYKNPKLGKWVNNHIWKYGLLKSGEKFFIVDERITQLENIGFQWIYDT